MAGEWWDARSGCVRDISFLRVPIHSGQNAATGVSRPCKQPIVCCLCSIDDLGFHHYNTTGEYRSWHCFTTREQPVWLLTAMSDALSVVPDQRTTSVGFLNALGNVELKSFHHSYLRTFIHRKSPSTPVWRAFETLNLFPPSPTNFAFQDAD